MAFKIGDVVRLKSGGPAMTVATVQSDMIWVEWFNRVDLTFSHQSAAFKPEMLEADDAH